MRSIMVGTSGLVGKNLGSKILQSPAMTALWSHGRRKSGLSSPKLMETLGAIDGLAGFTKPFQPDLAICCVGSTLAKAGSKEAFLAIDKGLTLSFARFAKQLGIERFHLVSSLGAQSQASSFYLKVKGETEAEVEALGFRECVIYRPSLLLGDREDKRPLEGMAVTLYRLVQPVYPSFLNTWKPIEAHQLAEVILQRMLAPQDGLHILENADLHRIYRGGIG